MSGIEDVTSDGHLTGTRVLERTPISLLHMPVPSTLLCRWSRVYPRNFSIPLSCKVQRLAPRSAISKAGRLRGVNSRSSYSTQSSNTCMVRPMSGQLLEVRTSTSHAH